MGDQEERRKSHHLWITELNAGWKVIVFLQADESSAVVVFFLFWVFFFLLPLFSWVVVVRVLGEMSAGLSSCHNPEGTCMTSCLIRCGIHGNWGSGMSCTAFRLAVLLANTEAAGLVAHMVHVSYVQHDTPVTNTPADPAPHNRGF